MPEGFYERDNDRFMPTDWARGPWAPESQHAVPPSALLGRAAEAIEPGGDWLVSRISVDILKPIPIAPLWTEAEVIRAGKRTQLVEATLTSGDTELARARVWRIKAGTSEVVSDALPHPLPEQVEITPMVHPGWDPSYFTALEWRYVSGSLFEPGPATVWMKLRQPLIADEKTSPLGKVLVCADSGNGVSSVMPLATHLFINVELSVHWVRPLRGDWVCLDANTTTGDVGMGVARSTIWDEDGCVAFGSQSLLIAER